MLESAGLMKTSVAASRESAGLMKTGVAANPADSAEANG